MLNSSNGSKSPISFCKSYAEISSPVTKAKPNHFLASVVIAGTITHPSGAVRVQLLEVKAKNCQLTTSIIGFKPQDFFPFLVWETQKMFEQLTDHFLCTLKSKRLSC